MPFNFLCVINAISLTIIPNQNLILQVKSKAVQNNQTQAIWSPVDQHGSHSLKSGSMGTNWMHAPQGSTSHWVTGCCENRAANSWASVDLQPSCTRVCHQHGGDLLCSRPRYEIEVCLLHKYDTAGIAWRSCLWPLKRNSSKLTFLAESRGCLSSTDLSLLLRSHLTAVWESHLAGPPLPSREYWFCLR